MGRAGEAPRPVSASAGVVQRAAQAIERMGDVAHFLPTASRISRKRFGRFMEQHRDIGALNLTPVERLALEMAVHEETERRALEGELAAIAAAWREAEEVAAIADGLLLPETVGEFLRRGREGA